MKTRTILVFVTNLLLFNLVPVSVAIEASFQGLGPPPAGDTYSRASSVSGDGSVVVGYSSALPYPQDIRDRQAFRWTQEDGMVTLAGANYSWASGVSLDGSVVVGHTGGVSSFLWTDKDGMRDFRGLPGVGVRSRAIDVSDDGTTVVGYGLFESGYEALRWRADDGIVRLGDLPGGFFSSCAKSVSADGSVVVGYSSSALGREPFYWTESQGMQGLGHLPLRNANSCAHAISPDGLVVVGHTSSTHIGDRMAFRWTAQDGMIGLGDIPGGKTHNSAWDVSANGSVIVGFAIGSGGKSEAMIWDRHNGMRSLQRVLEVDYGLDLTGRQLNYACGVSNDGVTIVGSGLNPDGFDEAWIATIPKPAIEADIDIVPDTLNLKSKGKWITCYIWLPEDYNIADVNSYSVLLEDEIEAEWIWVDEEEQIVMAKFNRLYVQDILEPGEVELTVTGELIDGTRFEGTDTIRVIDKGRTENRKAKP